MFRIRGPYTLKVTNPEKTKVLLPVGLPDEATFDWVDQFLSKNKLGAWKSLQMWARAL